MELSINPNTVKDLKILQAEQKFIEEDFYPGAPDEKIRVQCEFWINVLLETIIENARHNLQEDFVISQFMKTLAQFAEEDTEEREQAHEYLERIMRILGMDSSSEKISESLYGFDPGESN